MKRITWFMAALLVVALASPALAGSAGKCTQNVQACLNHWAKGQSTKTWAGLQYDTAENGTTTVKAITPGSPAASAGFEVGDVLVAMNGIKLADKEALKKAKADFKAGQVVTYTVTRAGAEKQLAVTLATMPAEVYASALGSHMLENHATAAMAATGTSESAKPAKK